MKMNLSPINRPALLKSDTPDMRWKWMAGSGIVAGAAAATTADAGVVQISLSNNQITSGGANAISADITSDGKVDLPELIASTAVSSHRTSSYGSRNYSRTRNSATVYSSGPVFKFFAAANHVKGVSSTTGSGATYPYSRFGAFAGGYNTVYSTQTGLTPQSARGLTAVTFTDARINGGAPTAGFVETSAFNTSLTSHTVQMVRTIFNDSSTAAPGGVVAGGLNREFDPTIYAQRTKAEKDIKKLKKKIKKVKKTSKAKAKKLKKKLKKLNKKLTALA